MDDLIDIYKIVYHIIVINHMIFQISQIFDGLGKQLRKILLKCCLRAMDQTKSHHCKIITNIQMLEQNFTCTCLITSNPEKNILGIGKIYYKCTTFLIDLNRFDPPSSNNILNSLFYWTNITKFCPYLKAKVLFKLKTQTIWYICWLKKFLGSWIDFLFLLIHTIFYLFF